MKFKLLPQPKQVRSKAGSLKLPQKITVGLMSADLHPATAIIREFFTVSSVSLSVPSLKDTITLATDRTLREGEYTLSISTSQISIKGRSSDAVLYGIQTLRQIAEQCAEALPCISIKDWPDFQQRGVYYDVCRGRVPELGQLLEMADQLSRFKINQLQLYIEHTFLFRRHPNIGKGASPLSAEDILKLDSYCAARGIELVPSLATFGHLQPVLRHREYHHLAEDRGVGIYEDPDDKRAPWQIHKAWSLSPAVPETYEFLDSLFAEFLPLFRSKQFNICCDETWDLGLGQSYKLCKKKGKGVVYLDHVKKVRALSAKYGKKAMFWGDIIRHYPELIERIPADLTVLDWGYGSDHKFEAIKDFKAAGLPFFACPGTSSWVALFPRLPEAMANIHGFAEAGHRNGAAGLLNTDWGDGGHYNFMEYSWHGYLFGAEQGWNTKADIPSFTERFSSVFFKSDSSRLAAAIDELGRIAHVSWSGHYQSLWQHTFFALPDSPLFKDTQKRGISEVVNGKIVWNSKKLNRSLASRYLKRIRSVKAVLVEASKERHSDPLGILAYWIFAADTIEFAIQKLEILCPDGDDSPANRKMLKNKMKALMKRFQSLWMQRNRKSEIEITLKRYRACIKAL